MSETQEHRLKRLHMRSIRRGIKEMDLILTVYANTRLKQLDDTELSLYDQLLSENDHDLYQWVSGQGEMPVKYDAMIRDIRAQLN